ncbi:MAG: hypothetical protein PHX61_03155 [Alphaproteobacteria bacterium]|nr:hypothetical protein [Alphaproteobacteria bacterium]
MGNSFQTQRHFYLARIKHMLSEPYTPPWSVVMQHESSEAKNIIENAISSTQDMVKAFKTMIESLEEGSPLETLIDYRSLPYYVEHDFSNDASGGAASALRDAALLITSFDPSSFSSHSPGKIKNGLVNYLNGTLHLWLLCINHQWQFIKNDNTTISGSSLLNACIPSPEREKATLSTMFKAICHSLHIGPLLPSPFINESALDFENRFKMKLWPSASPAAPKYENSKCSLEEISALFQHWYFSVGKTQTIEEHPKAAREAEDIFIELRSSMHEHLRSCHSLEPTSCDGKCIETAFSKYKPHPFGQQCYNAVTHIARNLAS